MTKDKLTSLYIPLFMSIIIALNISLSMFDIELCSRSSCKIVDNFLNIDSLYLNIGGLLFFNIFIMLAQYKRLSSLLLVYAFLFESFLISYQVFILNVVCYYCLFIYLSLFILMLLRNKLDDILAILFVFVICFNLLKFIPLDAKKIDVSKVVVYGSNDCKHCQDIKKYLSKHNIKYNFKNTNKVENSYLLKHLGITTIPVVVVSSNSKKEILIGNEAVKKYYFKDTFLKPIELNSFEGNLLPSLSGCSLEKVTQSCD